MCLCLECNGPVSKPRDQEKFFCSDACRHRHKNRRKLRGAELYDLFMTMRFDRAAAKEHQVWAVMCRMASQWNEEDKAAFTTAEDLAAGIQKPGRKSFVPVRKAMERAIAYRGTRHRVSK